MSSLWPNGQRPGSQNLEAQPQILQAELMVCVLRSELFVHYFEQVAKSRTLPLIDQVAVD